MRRVLLGILLLLPTVLHAEVAVFDMNGFMQMITQYRTQLQGYLESLKQTQQGIDQIKNQLNQIEQAKTQVQQGITNLQKLHINNASSLWSMGQQLEDKLRQADLISYDTNRAMQQAQGLYQKVNGVLASRDLTQMQKRWAGVQREAGLVSVNMEALQAQQLTFLQQNSDLMNRAAAAKGNLDIQQAQAQLAGMQNTQLAVIAGQLATDGRAQAVKTLEEATMKEATAAIVEQASGQVTLTTQADANARLLPLSK